MKHTFITSDLDLAATIAVENGIFPQAFDRGDPRKVRFIYKRNTDEVNQTVEKYHNRTLLVEPFAFANARRVIKDRIFSYGGDESVPLGLV